MEGRASAALRASDDDDRRTSPSRRSTISSRSIRRSRTAASPECSRKRATTFIATASCAARTSGGFYSIEEARGFWHRPGRCCLLLSSALAASYRQLSRLEIRLGYSARLPQIARIGTACRGAGADAIGSRRQSSRRGTGNKPQPPPAMLSELELNSGRRRRGDPRRRNCGRPRRSQRRRVSAGRAPNWPCRRAASGGPARRGQGAVSSRPRRCRPRASASIRCSIRCRASDIAICCSATPSAPRGGGWLRAVGRKLTVPQMLAQACNAVAKRASADHKIAERNNWLLDIGFDHLTLARSCPLPSDPERQYACRPAYQRGRGLPASRRNARHTSLAASSTRALFRADDRRFRRRAARTSTRRSRSPSAGRCGFISPTSIFIARGCSA